MQVYSVRVDWIMQNSHSKYGDMSGHEFFRDLVDSNNMEFFKIPALQIIIQYMFVEARRFISQLFMIYILDLSLIVI